MLIEELAGEFKVMLASASNRDAMLFGFIGMDKWGAHRHWFSVQCDGKTGETESLTKAVRWFNEGIDESDLVGPLSSVKPITSGGEK